MKKYHLLLAFVCLILLGCQKSEVVFDKNRVQQINIRINLGDDRIIFKEITDQVWIQEFVSKAYKGKHEPSIIFASTYKLSLVYSDTIINVAASNNYVKIGGKRGAFETPYNLTDFIDSTILE